MKTRNALGAGTSVWELADFMRCEAPEGWLPDQLTFKRDLYDLKGAGARWVVSAYLRVGDDGVFVLSVHVLEDIDSPAHGVRRSAPRLAFVERIKQRVARLGFFGLCAVDDHDGQCSGYFTRHVKDVGTLRGELSILAKLRLGQPARPRVAGRVAPRKSK